MSEEYMQCNFDGCDRLLTDVAWVTRCSHVFCSHHGDALLSCPDPQTGRLKCPACGDILSRNNGVTRNSLNPSDMMMSCIRPDKALDFAHKAIQLWIYQIQLKRKTHAQSLSQRQESLAEATVLALRQENTDLKNEIICVNKQLEEVNQKLAAVTERYNVYKQAFLGAKPHPTSALVEVRRDIFN